MMTTFRASGILTALCIAGALANPALASEDEDEVLAIADQALELISAEDFVGLTDLMLDTGMAYSSRLRDGKYLVRSQTYAEQRGAEADADFVERGFNPTVLVSGPLATIWYPYDFYTDGTWSHCGVDVFNLLRTDDGWRIASMLWSAEQPPACAAHPDGPPGGPAE